MTSSIITSDKPKSMGEKLGIPAVVVPCDGRGRLIESNAGRFNGHNAPGPRHNFFLQIS